MKRKVRRQGGFAVHNYLGTWVSLTSFKEATVTQLRNLGGLPDKGSRTAGRKAPNYLTRSGVPKHPANQTVACWRLQKTKISSSYILERLHSLCTAFSKAWAGWSIVVAFFEKDSESACHQGPYACDQSRLQELNLHTFPLILKSKNLINCRVAFCD